MRSFNVPMKYDDRSDVCAYLRETLARKWPAQSPLILEAVRRALARRVDAALPPVEECALAIAAEVLRALGGGGGGGGGDGEKSEMP